MELNLFLTFSIIIICWTCLEASVKLHISWSVCYAVQLTPARPRRPDTEVRLRPDQKTPEPITATTLRKSPVPMRATTTIAENDETPPPLPEKSGSLAEPHNDYANVGGSPPPHNDKIPPPVMRRTTHRGRVRISLQCHLVIVYTGWSTCIKIFSSLLGVRLVLWIFQYSLHRLQK